MTTKAEAIAILDRWQNQLPIGVDPTEYITLRSALIGYPKGKYHRPGRLEAAIGVGKTCLSFSPKLMDELGDSKRVRLEMEAGYLAMYPDPNGTAVIANTSSAGGFVVSSRISEQVRRMLTPGTRWVMVRNVTVNRWKGWPA